MSHARRGGTIFAAALAVALSPVLAAAADPDGRALYLVHCGRCHGPEGKGDGPDAASLDVPPADLSRPGLYAENDIGGLVDGIRKGVVRYIAVRPLEAPADSPRTTEVVRFLEKLPSVRWPEVEAGRELYLARCASCHGEYGEAAGAASLVAAVREMPAADLHEGVAHRGGGLPALDPPVAEIEIAPLASFVRFLSPGYATYRRHCESCHGLRGRSDWLVFDEAFFHKQSSQDLRARVWHMMRGAKTWMPHFADVLTEEEARAIVADLEIRATTTFQPWSP